MNEDKLVQANLVCNLVFDELLHRMDVIDLSQLLRVAHRLLLHSLQKHGDREMSLSDAIHAYLLHGAAMLSCVVDKTSLEMINVLEGICKLLLHLFHGRIIFGLFESIRICRQTSTRKEK